MASTRRSSFLLRGQSFDLQIRGEKICLEKTLPKTDETDPQWKRIMSECGVKVIYALSPQAKGKVERVL
jgi:hypothetical protein